MSLEKEVLCPGCLNDTFKLIGWQDNREDLVIECARCGLRRAGIIDLKHRVLTYSLKKNE